MKSRFEELRGKAIELRKSGASIKYIERELGIPRSTLSGWLRKVTLTAAQRKRLHTRWKNALSIARVHAVKWHNVQKATRHENAKREAKASLNKLQDSPETTELALALLYLGEGAKRSSNTMLGNSDPEILQFFITCLRTLYHIPTEKIKCDLHLRADQTPKEIIRYWAKVLSLPEKNYFCDSR